MTTASFTSDLYMLFLREMSGDKTAYEAIQKTFDLRPIEELSEFCENTQTLESVSRAIFIESVTRLGHNANHIWQHHVNAEMNRPWMIHENGRFLTRCSSERDTSGSGHFAPVLINTKFPRTDCGGVTVIYWLEDVELCEEPSHAKNASILSTAMEIKT